MNEFYDVKLTAILEHERMVLTDGRGVVNPHMQRILDEQQRASKRDKRLRDTYGITLEQHRAMYDSQGGKCGLCGQPLPYDKVQTDHDHETGKVRGLLCVKCNSGIGVIDKYKIPISRVSEWLKRGKV